MRTFESGATRDDNTNKLNYEGFLSPLVLRRYAEYMHLHRKQSDGTLRAADNWQKGLSTQCYMESLWRHFMDVWLQHRGHPGQDTTEDSLCALLFNTMGYLHETVKARLSAGDEAAAGPHLTCGDCDNRTCRFAGDLSETADPHCSKPKKGGK